MRGSADAGGDDDVDDAGADPGSDGNVAQPKPVTLTLTNRPTNAAQYSLFVAYQDGAAPWTLAPPPSGDTYTFTITSSGAPTVTKTFTKAP